MRLAIALRARPAATAGLILILLLVLACLLGPLLSPEDRGAIDPPRRDQGPSWAHPFGTGPLGEDWLVVTLGAGRASLAMAFLAAVLATSAGALLGVLAGWAGGWLDALLSRFVDLLLILPALVLLIVLSVALNGVGVVEVSAIIALLAWPPLFRLVRAVTRETRSAGYVEAALLDGAGTLRIARRHLLPAAAGEIAVFAALAVAGALLAETALSFLGLGLDPDGRGSWGSLMSGAENTIEDRPWLTIFPGALAALTALGAGLVADGLRDAVAGDARATARPGSTPPG